MMTDTELKIKGFNTLVDTTHFYPVLFFVIILLHFLIH